MTSGMVLGRFRLIEKVDACNAAVRYSAVNGELSAWIELLEPDLPDTAIQRLKDQRAALAKLRKARAVEVIEYGEEERRTIVINRRLPGEALTTRIRRGGLGALETLDLCIEIADALAEAHALGIAHGALSEKSIFFAAGGSREEVQILGFGLGGLSRDVSDQPTSQDDLHALGRVAYACLAGPEAQSGDPPARVLEKQTHLAREARDLVLRLLEEKDLASATAVGELARTIRTALTTDIVPIKPAQLRDGPKIEVVLRTTIEAANAADPDAATPTPHLEPYGGPARPRAPSQPRPLPSPPPAQGMSPIDGKTLFIAGAILILLILGLWIVTSSGGSSGDVVVESLKSE